MKNNILVLMILGSVSLFAAGDFVKDIRIAPIRIAMPEIQKEKVENITFYSYPNPDIPMAKVEIILYGSQDILAGKPYEIPQVLSFVLLYGGSKKHPGSSLLAAIENKGGRLEIVPEYKKTVIRLSFLTEDYATIMDLLEELLTSPQIEDQVIAFSKNRLIELFQRRNEKTESIGFRKTKELVFHGLQAGNSGSIDSIQKITKENLEDFFHYNIMKADKAVLVYGKQDLAETKNRIHRIFSQKLPVSGSYLEDQTDYSILKKSFSSFSVDKLFVEKDVTQSMVMMAGILPPHNHPDFFAVTVLNYILGGGGFNSYFMTRIRSDKGLAYASVSYPVFSRDFGVLYCYTLTKTESTNEVFRLMTEILSDKTIESITEQEIENAKNAIFNQFVFLFNEDSEVIRNKLRFDEDNMPENYLMMYRDRILAVKKEDILRVKGYFNYKSMKTIIVGKKEIRPENFKTVQPEDAIVE